MAVQEGVDDEVVVVLLVVVLVAHGSPRGSVRICVVGESLCRASWASFPSIAWSVCIVAWVPLFVANEEPDDPPESTSCPSQIQAKSGHASRMHESNRLEEMLLST